jgi:hypothetical protein
MIFPSRPPETPAPYWTQARGKPEPVG